MTRRLAYSLLASLFLHFSSCSLFKTQEDPAEESQRSYHPNGQLHKEIIDENDSVSIYREYFNNGQIFQEIRSVNKLREGLVKKYHKDGVLYDEIPYVKGKIHGTEKKYRRSGDLMAEIPYHEGNLCKGLKEYTVDGKLKKRYPEIIITPIDNILKDESYTVQISLSDGSKSVEYYEGDLTDGKYIGDDAGKVWETSNGVGKLQFKIVRGMFIMEELNIIAKVKTIQGNYYITEKTYHVALDNRF